VYKEHNLEGGHIIKLGPGNDEAALDAVSSWPGSIQINTIVIRLINLAKLRWTASRGWD